MQWEKQLGFNAVKSDNTRDKVGVHFENVKKGLEGTKTKLEELSGEISSTKNVDGSAIKVVNDAIKSANDVFDKLIGELNKLAGVTNEASGTNIGANNASNAVGADKDSINKIIAGIREIIKIANQFDVNIKPRNAGETVNAEANNAVAVLARTSSDENTYSVKLVSEVVKADPWAMIEKIKSSKDATGGADLTGTDNDAGALATKTASGNAGAKSSTDVAAAVALKAMTKNGKFNASANAAAMQGAAANAVNKVLGVLDEIIRRTVAKNLENVRAAVKGIKYSDTNGETTEVKK